MSRGNGGLIGKVNSIIGGDGDGSSSSVTSNGTFTIPGTLGAVTIGIVSAGGGGDGGTNVVNGGS